MQKHFIIIFSLIFVSSLSTVYAEQSVEIELVYTTGDRATINNTVLIIESTGGSFKQELIGDSSKQSFFAKLDPSQNYKIQVFMHDMLVSTQMVYPNDFANDVITVKIPTSVGVKFLVYYNDGTPITDTTVDLYSHNENLITSSNTDSKGQTLRFWISPTPSENNFYIPVVSFNDEIQYTHQDLRLISGSTDIRITTPWPSSADYLRITAQKDDVNVMNSWGDEYVAKISNGDFVQSTFFNRGDAHFSNIPIGTFDLVIFEQNKPKLVWANETIVVSEKSTTVDVIVSDPITSSSIEPITPNIEPVSTTEPSPGLDFTFLKQSISGNQTFDDSESYLEIVTDGDNSPVFTRSSEINQDLSDENFIAEISVDNPANVQELWISFTSDNFASGWYTYAIPTDLISKEPTEISITSDDLELAGTQTISSIDTVQIRVRDDGIQPVQFTISNIAFVDKNQMSDSCNCVAFRLDDIQDFFLTDIQTELIEVFQKNNIDLTIGVIANNIGKDIEITEFVKNIANDPGIEFANHGWEHEDFSQFEAVGQEMLLLRANEKISEMFGVTPTVFIPPLNSYNEDTIAALHSQGFTHYSSELDFATPPFPLTGQTLYHFPETAVTGELNESRTRFAGLSAGSTFNDVQESISEYGFAVITLHPQEFAQFYNQQYQNKVNYQQIEQLELLFTKIAENNIDTVFISEINTGPNEKQLVPQWVKNNAKWWIEEKVSTEEFVNSLEFLITQKIILVPHTESNSQLTSIPEWVKTSIKWWTEEQTTDSEFVSATQFMIRNGIIQI